MNFKDLKFDNRGGERPMGRQAMVFFANGYGVSVICGPHSYGGQDGLYELAVLVGSDENFSLTYATPVTSDVEGWLSEDDVTKLIQTVEALPSA